MQTLKKLVLTIIIIISLLCVAFIFKNSILRAIGKELIYENELNKVETLFVLGGGAFDRGNEAAKIYKAGFVKNIVCTSGNIPHDLQALGITLFESEITKKNIVRNGIPDSLVFALTEGTSTFEESDIILRYCKEHKIFKCILLSSKFHTRRVKNVFKNKFEKENIQIIFRGAPSSQYDENAWWEDERGLIMVNNEYVKLMYYWLKY